MAAGYRGDLRRCGGGELVLFASGRQDVDELASSRREDKRRTSERCHAAEGDVVCWFTAEDARGGL